ncbi:MAG: AAA family ATPase, partial [Thermodesulfobacteriota bacterium]
SNQLLVGGCLQGSDGRTLTFYRRKKRKADLLDLDGNSLDPGALAAFLHGIEPALFESLYGIDHKTLVQGGEDILAQKGEVGQALFAAGAGISSLKKIQDFLDMEADEFFRPRGTKQQINQALKRYKNLKKTVKEESLPSSKWKEHEKRLREAEAEQAELEKRSRLKSIEVQRLDRLNRAIPLLAGLENLQAQLRELGDVVLLPAEFPERLRQVEQGIRETGLEIENDRARLKKLQEKLSSISLNQSLLDHTEAIEDLHQRLGEYRKGLKDRNRLDGMRISSRKDAAALLEEVRPDLKLEDAESLRPVLSRKRTIRDLSARYESLRQKRLHSQKQKEEAEKELQSIADTLAGMPKAGEGNSLANACKPVQKEGDIDGQIEELSREITGGRKACQAELNRLGLWSGKLERLPGLALPLAETVRRFASCFNEIESERKGLRKERQKAEKDLQAARDHSRELVYGGEVPTESDLEISRRQRQVGWDLLLRQWLNGEDVSREAGEYYPDSPLHEAYERQVELADHIADRMRREADRVARAASLRVTIESLEEQILEISRLDEDAAARKRELKASWQAEWQAAGITPRSPGEMLAWLADIDVLRLQVLEIFKKEADISQKEELRQRYRLIISDELAALGKGEDLPGRELAPVLAVAESVMEEISRNQADLEKLTDNKKRAQKLLEKAEKELAEAEAARVEWREKWHRSLTGLGLAGEVLPAEALDLLDTIEKCLAKLEKANDFQSRIKGIDRDVDKFTGDVRTLLGQVAPDLKDLVPDQAVLQLYNILAEAKQDREFVKANNQETEALTVKIEKAEKKRQSLNKQMSELLAAAKCDKPADLATAIRKSAEFQRLQEKISDVETSLAGVSEGLSVDEIRRQAAEAEVDELPGQIESLRRQIDEELYPRIKEISKIIGKENMELQNMDGSARAAEAAEEMERTAAGIKRLIDRYACLKLAARVLQDEIERYREEHQDPVLKIASRFFAELTLGSFSGLRADVDDNGHPVLVGIRPDDTRVSVQGMSDGTCDQLYLALRLATLERRLESSEPIPFIVDDILINFDDERSRATLQALADLSENNQVILFTHHRQIVETAKKIRTGEAVFVHEL